MIIKEMQIILSVNYEKYAKNHLRNIVNFWGQLNFLALTCRCVLLFFFNIVKVKEYRILLFLLLIIFINI